MAVRGMACGCDERSGVRVGYEVGGEVSEMVVV